MFDPRIEKHLIADQGERVVDEVRKHWAATVSAVLELFAGVVVLLLVFWVPAQAWWVPVLLGGAITAHAVWRFFEQHLDRFVITNMRVFRVHGILSQRIATMPLTRILDISVHKPVVGRLFGYGHFVFESAAQEQGLRDIRYVGDPDRRGLTIQRVIQQAGLRGAAGRAEQFGGAPILPPAAEPARVTVTPAAEYDANVTAPVTEAARPVAAPSGWDWLAEAQRREDERLAQLRGEPAPAPPPFDPDRTSTAPINLPR
ncbi:PH domain-containing protein [Microbacterium sp. M3]|uniref:PH domain-containing protein n=1 Tax=Microbacterium arthrosphaerae TaxID=792652 RepID=A0ABU4GZ32_9MICO|nr:MULTISPECIES: PH domain-containing protein [Microbacterium]MDW4572333.1 PH domain-containing protein [Microbacterium arthrosphaerae]MDW7606188.1 PH domain-containing protein [Microbacterium sp. M3]